MSAAAARQTVLLIKTHLKYLSCFYTQLKVFIGVKSTMNCNPVSVCCSSQGCAYLDTSLGSAHCFYSVIWSVSMRLCDYMLCLAECLYCPLSTVQSGDVSYDELSADSLTRPRWHCRVCILPRYTDVYIDITWSRGEVWRGRADCSQGCQRCNQMIGSSGHRLLPPNWCGTDWFKTDQPTFSQFCPHLWL